MIQPAMLEDNRDTRLSKTQQNLPYNVRQLRSRVYTPALVDNIEWWDCTAEMRGFAKRGNPRVTLGMRHFARQSCNPPVKEEIFSNVARAQR